MEGSLAVMNLGVQLTLFRPVGADYAHHINPCPPGFENLTASLLSKHCFTLPSIWVPLLQK